MQLTESNLAGLLNCDEVRLSDELSKVKTLWAQLNNNSENANDKCESLATKVSDILTNNFQSPENSVVRLCQSVKAASNLMSYVFIRRFGWSESNSEEGIKITCRDLSHEKKEINSILDGFIRWFQLTPLCEEMVEAYENCFLQAQSKPVVRKQAVVNFLEWLALRFSSSDPISNKLFTAIKQSIIVAITDIWSAIRNACVSKFNRLVEHFSAEQKRECFLAFSEICNNESSLWQAKEGAVMGINAIIRQFSYSDRNFIDLDKSSVDFTVEQFSPGSYNLSVVPEVSEMPEFVTHAIHSVIFPLLAHFQLSIRDQAVRALSSYIARSNSQEVISVFDGVLYRLKESCQSRHDQRSFSVLQPTDAYEAESLLSLCVHFIKTLPADFWRQQRDSYVDTFICYLAHPASSVRQAASNIFKFLIAKDTIHQGFMVEILQRLSDGWQVDMVKLCEVRLPDKEKHLSSNGMADKQTNKDGIHSSLSDTWQWREGRMLAYELICMFLIKNHWLYTFGSVLLNGTCQTPPESNDDSASACASPRDNMKESPRDIPLRNTRSQDGRLSRRMSLTGSTQTQDHSSPFINPAELRRRSTSSRLVIRPKPLEIRDGYLSARFPQLGSSYTSEHMSLRGGSQTLSLLMYARKQEQLTTSHTVNEECLDDGDALGDARNRGTLADLLTQMLFQTIECLTDTQWELRRMAQQLLPCVCEVLRWYNIHILEKFWNTYLLPKTTLVTYGAVLSLKYSLHHAAKLQVMLDDPPATWQDIDLCKELLSEICTTVKSGLPNHWLPTIINLLKRSFVDKISLVALEALMVSEINFHKSLRSHYSMVIINFMTALQNTAHPNDLNLVKENLCCLTILPADNFLSCCTRSKDAAAIQALTAMLVEIQSSLPNFVAVAPYHSIALLLLLLSNWLSYYLTDDQLSKCLFISATSCCTCCSQYLQNCEEESNWLTSDNFVIETITRLAQFITKKTLDKPSRRLLQELYLQISSLVPTRDHLSILLPLVSNVCSKTRQNSRANILTTVDKKSAEFNNLLMRSNDIPTSPLPEKIDQSLSDEEDNFLIASATGLVQESHALDHSSNSGSISARFNASGGSADGIRSFHGEDDDSDWDDWDTEDHDDDMVTPALTDQLKLFLKKLQENIVIKEGNLSEWDRSVNKLPLGDRRTVLTLLASI